MLTSIHPKLPMRDKAATKAYYTGTLGFGPVGEYDDYLIVRREGIEIHFFEFKALVPAENYGQVYIRTSDVDGLYHSFCDAGIAIHPNGHLLTKPWGQREFSLLDPDNNLLTFGQAV